MQTKTCSKCKQELPLTSFSLRADVVRPNGLRYTRGNCKACATVEKRVYRKRNIKSFMLNNARRRADRFGTLFNITEQDIFIPETCPVLGIPLVISSGHAKPNSPSLDRIFPELGYIKGNIIVVSSLANTIKSYGTVEQIGKVYEFYKRLTSSLQNMPELNVPE